MATEKLYECMFLVDSRAYTADPDGAISHVVDLVEKAGGELSAHRPWADGPLAYEIEGQRKGLHYLTCFKSSESDTINKLSRSVRLSDQVLRHMVIKHPPVLYDALVAALGADPDAEEEHAEGQDNPEAATAGVGDEDE